MFSQGELEVIAAALSDTSEGLTGSEIGHLLASIKMIDPTPTSTKWVRLHNAFVGRQNRAQNRRATLEFMRHAMLPARHVKRPERFDPMRANLNRALAFSGLAVDAADELVSADHVKRLPEAARRADELRADMVRRGVRADVLRFCRAELVADNYFHAVLEASKSVADKLRTRAGLTDDGGTLVDAALCGSSPLLAINALASESQRSEQSGFANLIKGRFGMFRNPSAHEARILWAMSKTNADILTSLALFWTLPTAFLGGSTAEAGITAINAVGKLAGFVSPFMVGVIKDLTGNTTLCMHALATGLLVGAGPALAFARRAEPANVRSSTPRGAQPA